MPVYSFWENSMILLDYMAIQVRNTLFFWLSSCTQVPKCYKESVGVTIPTVVPTGGDSWYHVNRCVAMGGFTPHTIIVQMCTISVHGILKILEFIHKYRGMNIYTPTSYGRMKLRIHIHYRQKMEYLKKHNCATCIRHFDLLETACHQPQTSFITLVHVWCYIPKMQFVMSEIEYTE